MHNETILFLVNGKAGRGILSGFETLVSTLCNDAGIKFKIQQSEYAGHLNKLTSAAIKEGFKTIVVVGGDGSVNEVFSELLNTDVKLGILPLGSGNGLARHLKIPLNTEKALKLIINGNSKLIDSALINNIPFISIAGTGFDALIAKHFSNSKSRGFWNYFWLTTKYYFSYKPIQYHISSGTRNFSTKALLVSFSNSNQFGYNISVSPHANIEDGYLDICILKKPPLLALPLTIFYLLTGKIFKSKFHISFKTKRLMVSSNVKQLINVDGEYHESSQQIEVMVLPESLNVFVP